MKWISAYLKAGLDESLATFTKHLLATMFVAAVDYVARHLTHEGQLALSTIAPFVFGFPIVTSITKYLSSLPKSDPAVLPLPATSEFSGDIPAQA